MQTNRNQSRTVARRLLCVTALLVLAVVPQALSQTGGIYNLTWNTTDGGGSTSAAGGAYSLGGTIGQPDAGASSGGAYSLSGGFWGIANLATLKILSINRLANGHIRLQGQGVPGELHTMRASDTLNSGSFAPLSPPVAPNATGFWQFDDTTSPLPPKRFYRLTFP